MVLLSPSVATAEERVILDAQSALQSDSNGFPKPPFRGGAALWQTAEQFPRTCRKLDLAPACCQNSDASFTEAFSRSLVPR